VLHPESGAQRSSFLINACRAFSSRARSAGLRLAMPDFAIFSSSGSIESTASSAAPRVRCAGEGTTRNFGRR